MSKARQFWADVNKDIAGAIDRIIPKRATVDTVGASGIKIKPIGANAALGKFYAQLAGLPNLSANDEVAYVMLGGEPFVLGRIRRAAESDEFVWESSNGFIFQGGGDWAKFGIKNGNGDYVIRVNTASNPEEVLFGPDGQALLRFFEGSDLEGYSDAGVTLKWSIDGATGDAEFNDLTINGTLSGADHPRILVFQDADSWTSAPSNSSTTMADANSVSVTLPTTSGDFDLYAFGGCSLFAYSGADHRVRINIDGNTSGNETHDSLTDDYVTNFCKHSVLSKAGNDTFNAAIQYSSSSTHTVYLGAAWITVIAIEQL